MQWEEWEGYRKRVLSVNGRESYVVCPEEAAEGRPWIWRAEYFGAFDSADRALLKRGWHIGFHKVSNMFGCPASVESMKAFHDKVCEELALSPRAVLFGFSAGGAYSLQYAGAYPEDVRALYLDAPAIDLRIFERVEEPEKTLCDRCGTPCGLTVRESLDKMGIPMERTDFYAAHHIPILLVAGLRDEAAVYDRHGGPFVERYRAAGGEIETILKPECAHHPHSLEDPQPIVDWILAH